MKNLHTKLQRQIFGMAGVIAVFVIRNKNQSMATLILGYFSPLRQAVEFAAEKVRKAVNNHTFFDNIRITISMGVTVYNEEISLQEMLLDADSKMYKAKQQGRDRVIG